ncbi:early endosome antigen 1 [Aethina tumida]|uniref:early endosome antigen 1 n=1 Tax=Aethina tumida TaxID=116153 RepID=UPI0021488E06|nr:early endosome antigen 1 [Aethina tumida]
MADALVQLIKSELPNFTITKEKLLHPTSQLVTQFYSEFIASITQFIVQLGSEELTGFNDDPDLNEFPPEIVVYAKVSKIFSLYEAHGHDSKNKFTLYDIYNPQPKRFKTFCQVCVHCLMFFRNFVNNSNICRELLEIEKETESLHEQREQKLQEINKNAQLIVELEDQEQELLDQKKSVEQTYEEMLDTKKAREMHYEMKQNEIENLTQETDCLAAELDEIRKSHSLLQSQITTQSEYDNLLSILNRLKEEARDLEGYNENIGEGLESENNVLKHLEVCKSLVTSLLHINFQKLEELPQCKVECKTLLNDKNEFYQNLGEIQAHHQILEDTCNHLKQAVTSIQKECDKHFKIMEEDILKGEINLSKLKKEKQKKYNELMDTKDQYTLENFKCKESYAQLQKKLDSDYNKILQLERDATEKFSKQIAKLQKASENF